MEPAELNVEDNQEVLVLREELGPLSEGQRSRPTTPGWVFAVSDQNSGYVPRTYLEAEEDLAQSMTVRYVSKAERNTAAYNEAAVGQTTQGDYWVQKMAAELDSSDALDAPARPPSQRCGRSDGAERRRSSSASWRAPDAIVSQYCAERRRSSRTRHRGYLADPQDFAVAISPPG